VTESPRPARSERAALADLLAAVGPEAPTLCPGWVPRDLAAHLIVRERRPDAAAGIVLGPLKGWMERVRNRTAARPYDDLVDRVRHPPWWSMSGMPPVDALVNTTEFFVHHEDVRRAQPDWSPRELRPDLEKALWRQLSRVAKLGLRRFPAAAVLASSGYGEIRAGAGGPEVRVSGPPGELAIFLSGRQRAARVALDGPPDLVTRLRQARLGV
jgi:uncharacterized protein (TIGR03085 family)